MNKDPHIFRFCGLTAILSVTALSCTSKETVLPPFLTHLLAITSRAVSLEETTVNYYIFNRKDGLLDSCGSLGNQDSGQARLISRSGEKTAVLTGGLPDDKLDYTYVLSMENLSELHCSLTEEDSGAPVLCGVIDFDAGGAGNYSIELTPLMAKVVLRSLRVDFSGTDYGKEQLKNARAYLINVNGLCPLLPGDDANSRDVLNQGKLDAASLASMRNPSLLLSDKAEGAELYCYPGQGGDALGQNTTRLVVEGQLAGKTCYWSFDVGNGKVERGHCYIFDITLTRAGWPEPDIAAGICAQQLQIVLDDWKEEEDEIIDY